MFILLKGNIVETIEVQNNYFATEASFFPCESNQRGFSKILDAKITGGGIVSLGEDFNIHMRIRDCIALTEANNPTPPIISVSGNFFQDEDAELTPFWVKTAHFKTDEKHLQKSLITSQFASTNQGLLIERESKCWPSNDLAQTGCSESLDEFKFKFSQNAALCNRHWKLNLVVKSVYDGYSYTSEYLVSDMLAVCPDDTFGILAPAFLDTPVKFIPGQTVRASLETTVAESWPSDSQFDKSSNHYVMKTMYRDCGSSSTPNQDDYRSSECKMTPQGK